MKNPSPPFPIGGVSQEGIEVVELWEIDLDFAVEEAFREGRPPVPEKTHTEPARAGELGELALFRGVGAQDLAAISAGCHTIHAVPGYVLVAPGKLNSQVFFVLEGQLRVYAPTNDKRPIAIADVGHSTGLRPAILGQPANHAVVATELSYILAIERTTLEDCAQRSHAFARNYAALLASYLRGDNCLHVGGQSPDGTIQQGYVDPLTLLHNQAWLDTMFPRIVARYRMGGKTFAVTAFAVEQLDHVIKEHGTAAGLRLLQAVGRWLVDQTRPTDLLAINKNRHILVFLPDGDLNAARLLAERLKTQIQTLSIALDSPNAHAPIKVTFAFGVAALEKGMKEKEFLSTAEAQIEKSKKRDGTG